ncbi:MAG: outer membrane lipoprotein carrier protein LolA [Planctomycetes bacterium]|nr:outer membrane lipoprotein carrier protein LolA [Planctomycetota bacterium]
MPFAALLGQGNTPVPPAPQRATPAAGSQGQGAAPAPQQPNPPSAAAPLAAQEQLALRPRPADLAALFALLGRATGLEAEFREEKHLALLAVPLQSRGRLYFLPPGYLTRVVEAPEPATLSITPKELRLQNRDGTEVVDLQRSDKVRTFVAALVQVFAADRAGLEKAFTLGYRVPEGDERTWTLVLVPRGKPLDQLLARLELHGRGEAVQRIEMHEPGGDRTVTTIVSADPQRRFDPAEQQRWFGIAAK